MTQSLPTSTIPCPLLHHVFYILPFVALCCMHASRFHGLTLPPIKHILVLKVRMWKLLKWLFGGSIGINFTAVPLFVEHEYP